MDPMYVDGGFVPVRIAVEMFAIILAAIGFSIIRRLMRDPDESPDHWRSHRK